MIGLRPLTVPTRSACSSATAMLNLSASGRNLSDCAGGRAESDAVGAESGEQVVQRREQRERCGHDKGGGRRGAGESFDPGASLGGDQATRRVVPQVEAAFEVAVEAPAGERTQVERRRTHAT